MKKLLKFLLFFFAFCLFTFHLKSQWVQQTVPVSKPIQGIKFIDSLTGWACTGNAGSPNEGYVLHTTNGGTNWFIQLTNPSTSFNAIAVVNTNVIYAGGSDGNGRLFKSTNGGTNWTDIGVPSRVTDMVFLNQDSGYYCADFIGADVRTTTDGGASWQVRISGIASQTLKIVFLNYSTGFCAANNTELYKTTNAGVNWNSIYNSPELFFSMYFLNETTGWAGLAGGKIGFTTNGGINWNIQQPFPLNSNNTTDIFFTNSNTGYAGTGWFQKILKTTNSGLNWGYQVVPTGSVKISILDTINSWVADFGISRTTNGGGSITYVGINSISNEVPISYMLYQNYPNPFNPATKINFDIKAKSFVRLVIFDVLGRIVSELVNEKLNAGKYEYVFEAADLPTGTYFYWLSVNNFTETKKMVLVK